MRGWLLSAVLLGEGGSSRVPQLTPSCCRSALCERVVRLPTERQPQLRFQTSQCSLNNHVPIRRVTDNAVVRLEHALLVPVLRLAVLKVHRVRAGLSLGWRSHDLCIDSRASLHLVDLCLDPSLLVRGAIGERCSLLTAPSSDSQSTDDAFKVDVVRGGLHIAVEVPAVRLGVLDVPPWGNSGCGGCTERGKCSNCGC